MIVDCHTHIWDGPEQMHLGRIAEQQGGESGSSEPTNGHSLPEATLDRYLATAGPVMHTFVLGFKSRYLGIEIPTSQITRYVRQQPDRLIGFAGIDPTDLAEAQADLAEAASNPAIRGITVSPAAQAFHPADSRAMQVFAQAAAMKMPVLLHQGLHGAPASKLEFARPVLLDEVARELPQLRLVVAHMGYPWVDECVALLGRHPHMYADISAILHRPWHAYNALVTAYQCGVMDKLLFGSDFPYNTATAVIENIYRINQLVTGTNLPTIPRQYLAEIVERDTLALLGIAPVPLSGPSREPELVEPHEA